MKKNCAHCGKEFEARRSNAKYCRQSCRTSASYKRNGYIYQPGHYKKSGKPNNSGLANVEIIQPILQELGSIDSGRSSGDFTLGGFLESLAGASASSLLTHHLTKDEYKESFALLQKTMDQILLEMKKLNGNDKKTPPANNGMPIPAIPIQKMGMPMLIPPTDHMM